jgi:hypothetical protein
MVAAIMTGQTYSSQSPLFNKKIVFVSGAQATVNSDWIDVAKLTTVEGAFMQSSTGIVGTCTFGTNRITITNADNLVWSGFCWGS